MGRILSVEINNRNIKILEGSRSGSSIAVYKSLFLDIESGSVDDGKIIDMDLVAANIEMALKSNNIKSKKAIFIINTNATITRNMELPVLKKNSETFSMIKSELDQMLPVDIDQYKIVYKKIDSIKSDKSEKGTYIAYGLPASIYEQYIELAERLNFELVAIDLTSSCLDKIALKKLTINKKHLSPGTSVAFIDIGFTNTLFSIVNNGKEVFSRISSNGLNDIVKNFEAAFNLTREEALEEIERLSLAEYTDDTSYISKLNILENNVNMWTDEFYRFIRYYNSNNKDRQIENIYIYGSFANINGLEQFIESSLSVSTERINEISNVVSKSGEVVEVKSYLNNILSLYIDKKDINFLSDRRKEHSNKFRTGVFLMAAGLSAVLLVSFYAYSYIVEKIALERDIETLDAYLENQENIKLNDEVLTMKKKVSLMEKYLSEADKLKTAIKIEDAVNTVIFEQVSLAIPHGTRINAMSVDKESIQLQCTSASRQEAAQFERNLKQVEFIDNVYVPAVVDSADGGSISCTYSLVCSIKDVITNEAE
ncbi:MULTISPECIES: pilus assembly protein PilM [unclassified Sedimentibacter]|uniref:pilus assembly protein PilM n=1 Tax=unclassified Sedimentibacter TaxID=2649220 RepID=UPI0027E0BBF1|nr:pilus assembly protein PilM [Sedimentibacter sp. MB35-C1]WMJ76672.1 pilus assembly protein PilM [Sedimentibacter sp. MB35-C1]